MFAEIRRVYFEKKKGVSFISGKKPDTHRPTDRIEPSTNDKRLKKIK